MKPWNLLVTSLWGHERNVFRKLKQTGQFKRSDFRAVYIGLTEDMEAFLNGILANTPLVEKIGKVVPVEHTFQFRREDFEPKVAEALLRYLPRLENARFHVRMERRGFKGWINSLEIEQKMDRLLKERLLEKEKECGIDFKDPDCILVIETVADWCGVGLISREMKQKYPFINVR